MEHYTCHNSLQNHAVSKTHVYIKVVTQAVLMVVFMIHIERLVSKAHVYIKVATQAVLMAVFIIHIERLWDSVLNT